MVSNSHNSRGSSTKARKAVSPLRVFCMAVVLALWVGNAGQPFSAQAAPAKTSIDTWLVARKLKGDQTICVGDKVVINVEVWKRVEGIEEQGGDILGRLIGVDVQASVVDPSIGSINPQKNTTRISSPPGRAYFTFTAENPGTTFIQFWGKVNVKAFLGLEISSNEVNTKMPVKVEDCEYKVQIISDWKQQGGTFSVGATIYDAGMTMDRPGHYKGIAVVEWSIYTNIEGGCTVGEIDVPTSTAKLYFDAGTPDDPEYILFVDFEPNKFKPVKISCPNLPGSPAGTASPAFEVKPGPLTIRFPASGGAHGESHSLTNFPDGNAFVLVKRVTKQ